MAPLPAGRVELSSTTEQDAYARRIPALHLAAFDSAAELVHINGHNVRMRCTGCRDCHIPREESYSDDEYVVLRCSRLLRRFRSVWANCNPHKVLSRRKAFVSHPGEGEMGGGSKMQTRSCERAANCARAAPRRANKRRQKPSSSRNSMSTILARSHCVAKYAFMQTNNID